MCDMHVRSSSVVPGSHPAVMCNAVQSSALVVTFTLAPFSIRNFAENSSPVAKEYFIVVRQIIKHIYNIKLFVTVSMAVCSLRGGDITKETTLLSASTNIIIYIGNQDVDIHDICEHSQNPTSYLCSSGSYNGPILNFLMKLVDTMTLRNYEIYKNRGLLILGI